MSEEDRGNRDLYLLKVWATKFESTLTPQGKGKYRLVPDQEYSKWVLEQIDQEEIKEFSVPVLNDDDKARGSGI